MRLKLVKIAGFKSFVEPTRLHLPSELVGIVGPNGCGKSNTLDAVRWVMGESSAKELRGGDMNDVLFNGTDSRKAVSQCSVELVFDNEQGLLGGAYSAYAEVSVKRVHHREEGTQYFLNQRRCRRRDVLDVFNGTGLGSRSYALIGQGNISRIIEAKPDEMRVYLEEVAGIGVYRTRRKETLSRLARVGENLAQLTILQEALREQAEHLALQAEKARDYRQTQTRLQQVEQRVYYHQWQTLHQQLEAAQSELRQVEKQFAMTKQAWDEAQKQFLLQRQALPAFQQAREQVEAAYHALDKRVDKLLQQQLFAQQQHQQWQHQAVLNQQQLATLAQQQTRVDASIEEQQRQLEELDEHLEVLEEAQGQSDQAWLSLQNEKSTRMQAQQQAQWQVERLTQNRVQTLSQLTTLADRNAHLQQELATITQAMANTRVEQIELQRVQLGEQLAELEVDSTQAAQQKSDLFQSLQQLKASLQTLQEQRQQQSQHLRSLEAEAEGLAKIQHAIQGRDQPETLAQLGDQAQALMTQLQVDNEWQTAVEAWLGECLQGVLLAHAWHESEAVPNVSLLAWNPTQVAVRRGSLAEKIHAPPVVRHWANQVYCRDESLPLAQQLAQIDNQAWLIDRAGQRYSAYGVQPNLAQEWHGALARQSRLQALAAQQALLQDELAKTTQMIQTVQQQVAQAESEYETSVQGLQQIERMQQRVGDQLSHLDETYAQGQATLQSYQQTHAACLQRHAQLQPEQAALNENLLGLDFALEQAMQTEEEAGLAVEAVSRQMQPIQIERDRLTLQLQRLQSQRQQLVQSLSQARFESQQYHVQAQQLSQQAALMARHQQEASQFDEQALIEAQQSLAQVKQQWMAAQQTWQAQQAMSEQYQQQAEAAQQQHLHAEQALVKQQLALQTLQQQRQSLQKNLEAQGWQLAELSQIRLETDCIDTLEQEYKRLKLHLSRLGAVNMTAIEAFDEVEQKRSYLNQQIEDLNASVQTLEQAIATIDRDSRQRLTQTFNEVNQAFKQLFPQLFQGGEAGLFWQDSAQDPLEGGVEVMARPPGKRNARIQLLSGGEKTLAALALIFAIFQLKPAPFCILDEVDAPLDDSNVIRFCGLVRSLSEKVQFIFITHNKTTMAMAKHLIGVTMHEAGVSRLVSVDLQAAVEMIGESGL